MAMRAVLSARCGRAAGLPDAMQRVGYDEPTEPTPKTARPARRHAPLLLPAALSLHPPAC